MRFNKISPAEARKIALHSQLVLQSVRKGRAIDVTREAIEKLGYVQIDTISVIQRAHHHTLWNRNPRYKTDHLDTLLQNRSIFEYWSHAAACLPVESYRMCLPRMAQIKSGDELWFKADPKIKRKVLERIRVEGPLQSKDFENHGKTKLPMWEWKPAKYALETLFMEGELMVTRRDKFQKVYDLRERVLPEGVDTTPPNHQMLCEFLIKTYLNAHGFGTAAEIAYLRKGLKKPVELALSQLTEDKQLEQVTVSGLAYYCQAESLELINRPLARSRLKLLSPFDNLVIQRDRIRRLFGFDYQIECYVPEKKRKFGYFCLPILWNANLVGRIDCKADRKTEQFIVKRLFIEDKLAKREVFGAALKKELDSFMKFNGCRSIRIERCDDKIVKQVLVAH